ncbi:MAG: FAD-dependent monooxygenase [Paracoccaceae bacterium]
MQFHLNGFRPGDPRISEPLAAGERPLSLPEETDVLIVGCGPAGLTLAAQMAAFPDIRTVIVDQKTGPLEQGQADGIAVRTMEMFQAFGFADQVKREAYWVNEATFWKPDPENSAGIIRTGRIEDTEDGLSEFPHVILNQARVHDFYLDVMHRSPQRAAPCYGRRFETLNRDQKGVTATFTNLTTGKADTIRARYVVGCDGARSGVRSSLGLQLEGDSDNAAWGVMDVLAVTDFPDIRLKSLIQSKEEGSILIIPREGGYMARFYIELDKLRADERVRERNITADHLIAAANRILRPYTLDVKDVAWWSVYEIGQRLCARYDDASEGVLPRVFIAGDACHTHSPKAGQGMNVSMQDTFNLGWKLAGVVRGQYPEDLLTTYSEERQAVAQELIDFDREWARVLAGKTGSEDDRFDDYFSTHLRYTAGTTIRYAPSRLTGDDTAQDLATGFQVGMRFHSAPVIRLADAKPMELGHVAEADGRWRLYLFGSATDQRLRDLHNWLDRDPTSPRVRYTPEDADPDAVIDIRAVFREGHRALELAEMPPGLLPRKGRYGLADYEKMFCPDPKADIWTMRGLDPRGCMVLVRPDQFIAQVLPLESQGQLTAYFDGFMLPQRG